MSETKLLPYFESADPDGLGGYGLCGFVDCLPHAIGSEVWERVHRVGPGQQLHPQPRTRRPHRADPCRLGAQQPGPPETHDPAYPEIEEQYEGWFVWLDFDEHGTPRRQVLPARHHAGRCPPLLPGRGRAVRHQARRLPDLPLPRRRPPPRRLRLGRPRPLPGRVRLPHGHHPAPSLSRAASVLFATFRAAPCHNFSDGH